MISAIICTHNPDENILREAVDAALAQEGCPAYEIIIIDNASTYAVADLEFIRRKSIHVIKEPQLGLTAARECAARNAAGDIIVFIDDDNVLEPSYLKTIDSIFKNASIGVVSGTVRPRFLKKPGKWFKRFEAMLALREFQGSGPYLTSIPYYNYYFPIGAGMGIRKRVLVDYFDSLSNGIRIEGHKGEALSSGEDIDIDLFAIFKGYLVGAFPQLKLIHIIPPYRCELSYIRQLAKASVESSWRVNEKWKHMAKQAVFDHYHHSKLQILVHLVLRLILYPFKRYRVAFDVYLELFMLLGKELKR